jgi:hypothetical protein
MKNDETHVRRFCAHPHFIIHNSAFILSSRALPENVNYAVKSSYLLSFLESVPEVSARLKEPRAAERKFEDVVKDAEQAAVLVLVY